MNLTQLRYALEVQRAGSISKAAENLYMGQPNLSKAIKELETSLGIRLFKRAAAGVTPTPEGRAFLEKAKALLEQFSLLESAYGLKGTMTLIMPPLAAAKDILPMCANAPAFASTPEVIERVAGGEFTLGLISYLERDRELYAALLRDKSLKLEPLRARQYAAVEAGRTRTPTLSCGRRLSISKAVIFYRRRKPLLFS